MHYLRCIGTLFLLVSLSVQACEALVSKDADRLLAPIINHRASAFAEEFDKDRRWKGESKHTVAMKKELLRLLRTPSRAGDEAIAALSRVYLGEHSGEEVSLKASRKTSPFAREGVFAQPR